MAASCGFGPGPEPVLLGPSVKSVTWVYMKQCLLSNSRLTHIQALTRSVDLMLEWKTNPMIQSGRSKVSLSMYEDSGLYRLYCFHVGPEGSGHFLQALWITLCTTCALQINLACLALPTTEEEVVTFSFLFERYFQTWEHEELCGVISVYTPLVQLHLYFMWMWRESSGVLISVCLTLMPVRFMGLAAHRKHSQLLVWFTLG